MFVHSSIVMLSIPVFDNGVIHYLSFPIGYRMWTKEETKLDMAADMIREVMDIIGHERNVCLCCDSWYPKGEIAELPQQYDHGNQFSKIINSEMVILTPITINNHFNNANYVTKVDHLCSERHTFNFLLKKVDFRAIRQSRLDMQCQTRYRFIRSATR